MSAPTPARRAAYEVLRRVFEHGAWADRALRSAAGRYELEGRERGQAQRLAYGSVQRRGTSDYLIAAYAERRVERIDAPLLAALRLGAFELLFTDGAAEHAAVDQAVELAKGGRDGGRRHRGAGLVNAVLRRIAREGEATLAALDPASAEGAAVIHSLPVWITELWIAERGPEAAARLMVATNEPPHHTYRATGVAGELPAGLEPVAGMAPGAELLTAATDAPAGAGAAIEAAVTAGTLIPQSRGSALAAAALEAAPGERLLDLCAAPGIKTTQLATAVGPHGSVTAVERDPGRVRQLEELCERLGVGNVTVLAGDATELDVGAGYDRVLVDAPCTGLGTLASRPDARWRRVSADVDELARLQSRLLDRGLEGLRDGGRAVYSVCTISRAEGEAVAGAAAKRSDVARVVDLAPLAPGAEAEAPAPAGSLELLPGRDGTDGFFIAALERSGGGA